MAKAMARHATGIKPSSTQREDYSPSIARADAGYARRWLTTTRVHLAPGNPGEILVHLTRLSLHFYQQGRPDEQLSRVLEDYVEDLADYPADIIAAACREWRREGTKWWPKVSELIALARPLHRARKHRLEFLEALLAPAGEPALATPQGKPICAEQRQKIDAWLAEEGEKAAAHRAKTEAPPRPIHVPLSDEDREAALARVKAGEVLQ